MMRALDRKLLRDLARMRTQAVAIALVVAAGMSLYIGTAITSRALTLSERQYYEDHRFAHVWSRLARAPDSVIGRLAAIPGVAAADGRLVAQGVLDLPHLEEPATGLFVAIPSTPGHVLNDVYIRRGRHVERGGANEALVNEPFAEKTGLKPGDSVRAVIAGQQVALQIVGVALSPEFLMQVPPGALLPDDRRFGVFWLAREDLARLLDLREAVNDIALRLSLGAPEGSVIAAVDRVLDAYGGQGAYGRSSQPSHVMLADHITPLAVLAAVVPGIFLLVAVFLINMVLSRLVSTERTQIGMLKAFGYSNARLARHYLLLAVFIVSGGILLGLPVGIWLGRVMATWFATFFRFPVLVLRLEPVIVLIGVAAMLGSSALGAVGALLTVARMSPVVAMSPPAPTYRPTFIDRMGAIMSLGTTATRMILRNIVRRPTRATSTMVGMSLSIAIVVLGGFSADSMERIVDVQFHAAQRQDLSIVLTHARSLEQWAGFEQLPGVRVAEPYRVVPVRLHAGGQARDMTLIGLDASSRLRHIVDTNYQVLSVPPEGVVISGWLASQAHVHRGDVVALEIREGRRRVVTSRVVALVDEPLGTNMYIDLRTLGRLLDEPNTFAAVDLLVDPVHRRDLFAVLKRAPAAQAVEFRPNAIVNFRAMGDASIAFIRKIEIVFAVIIAFGVVYNTARIAVAERAHELATLRVLGFTRREISTVLLGEIALLAAPAIPLGCALGYGLSVFLTRDLSTELFRMPIVVLPRTYAFALIVFAAATISSALVVRRRLDHLDLVAVLKARE